MKKSRFSEQQIAFVLRQAEEGTPIVEVCRKAGISEASYYAWRKKYRGLLPSEMKRLKQLEEENQRLKKLVADLSLDKRDAAGRDPPENMKPVRKREMVDDIRRVWQIGIRRACQALPVDRSTYHYRPKRSGQAVLMKRIKEPRPLRISPHSCAAAARGLVSQ